MTGLAIWFVVGWISVLVQNQWGYQFMLPLVPIGLFAVVGVDRLCGSWAHTNGPTARRVTIGFVIVAVAVAFYPAREVLHTTKELVRDDFTLTGSGRHRFEAEFEPYYPEARAAAAFVREAGRTPGPIHVEGNPLIQYLSGRPYALRLHGWAPEQSDARLWKWTRDGLQNERPAYVWIDRFSLDVMRARSPETVALVDSRYCRVRRIGDGTWYALRDSHECTGAR